MPNRIQHASERTALERAAAQGGMVGPALFVAIVMLGGWLSDGYSHAGQKISELGGVGADYAALQNVNFIVLGILVLGFTWTLGRHLGPPYHGPVLLSLFGVLSCIANGLLPCDAACVGETPVALAHNVTGLLGFVAAIVGMIVLARRWRHDPRWRYHVAPTIGVVIVALVGLIWFIASQATDPHDPLGGLAQRVFVGALLLWIARTAWLLDRQLTATDQPTPTQLATHT
jgi:hypothetical membrane protein